MYRIFLSEKEWGRLKGTEYWIHILFSQKLNNRHGWFRDWGKSTPQVTCNVFCDEFASVVPLFGRSSVLDPRLPHTDTHPPPPPLDVCGECTCVMHTYQQLDELVADWARCAVILVWNNFPFEVRCVRYRVLINSPHDINSSCAPRGEEYLQWSWGLPYCTDYALSLWLCAQFGCRLIDHRGDDSGEEHAHVGWIRFLLVKGGGVFAAPIVNCYLIIIWASAVFTGYALLASSVKLHCPNKQLIVDDHHTHILTFHSTTCFRV